MVFGFLKDTFESVTDSIKEANKESVKEIILSESLSCNKCDALAVPIYESDNKYKCTGCSRQFSNSKHYIGSKIRRKHGKDMKISYKKAVAEINS